MIRINNISKTYHTDKVPVYALRDVNLSIKPGEHLALVGFSGSGKSTLALCIGQLYKYTGGHVLVGSHEVSDLSKLDMINNIGFVAQMPFIFDGTIEDNLLYSWIARAEGDGNIQGNALPSLDDVIAILQQTGIFLDVLRFGMNTILSHDEHQELVSRIIRIRKNFQREFGEDLANYVEFYNQNKYLYHSSVAENLIFGSPNRDDFNENLSKKSLNLFLKSVIKP